MSDDLDLLKAATRALKDETAGGQDDGRFTRARVMASLHQGKVKRRTRLAFVLPIAACLAAGTAWGAATGKLPAVFRALSQAVSYTPRAPQPQVPARSSKPAANSLAPLAAAEPSANPVPVASEAPAPVRSAAPTPAVPSSRPSLAPASNFQDADSDLYRLAHDAHFGSHDYTRALVSWDAYLRAAPRGRFSTEARYNRAICLLRLGRDAEARVALEPFASGKMGYRQAEAQQLLNELGP